MTEVSMPDGLHRSVNPRFFRELVVSQEAFSPTNEEGYKLSVDCEKVWKARSSYEFRTKTLGKLSAGIWTLSREEYSKVGLSVVVDHQPGNHAHSLVIFPVHDRPKRRDLARRLAFLANQQAYSQI